MTLIQTIVMKLASKSVKKTKIASRSVWIDVRDLSHLVTKSAPTSAKTTKIASKSVSKTVKTFLVMKAVPRSAKETQIVSTNVSKNVMVHTQPLAQTIHAPTKRLRNFAEKPVQSLDPSFKSNNVRNAVLSKKRKSAKVDLSPNHLVTKNALTNARKTESASISV